MKCDPCEQLCICGESETLETCVDCYIAFWCVSTAADLIKLLLVVNKVSMSWVSDCPLVCCFYKTNAPDEWAELVKGIQEHRLKQVIPWLSTITLVLRHLVLNIVCLALAPVEPSIFVVSMATIVATAGYVTGILLRYKLKRSGVVDLGENKVEASVSIIRKEVSVPQPAGFQQNEDMVGQVRQLSGFEPGALGAGPSVSELVVYDAAPAAAHAHAYYGEGEGEGGGGGYYDAAAPSAPPEYDMDAQPPAYGEEGAAAQTAEGY